MFIDFVIGKVSGQQKVIRKVFGESKVTLGFLTAWGIGAPQPILVKVQLCFGVYSHRKMDTHEIRTHKGRDVCHPTQSSGRESPRTRRQVERTWEAPRRR